jgi:hypothetical protein
MFKQYPKIHRLGAEETDGILYGTCHIEEKIDGANTSIWVDQDGVHTGSRTREITGMEFRGFNEYVNGHAGIQQLLKEHPTYRLYGEWLVPHTVQYKETVYKEWYMFDIIDESNTNNSWMNADDVIAIADKYQIKHPALFAVVEDPTVEQILEYVGKSELGTVGEGVVIKNHAFVNKFGDMCYAKMVTEKFKEENSLVFGGNNKHSERYWEMYCVNKFVTLERVRKIVNKLNPTLTNGERLGMQHIPRILGMVYHDIITEDAWEIAKKVPVLNFKILQRLVYAKTKKIYVDILNDFISVAYDSRTVPGSAQ